MILELTVENIAVIERAQLTLGSGFTCITGETGAGKSLLIDSIALALGGRADSDLVRTGTARGTVAMVVDLSANPAARSKCEELGVETEDLQLFIQREISAEGRSTCRVGGRLVPVSTLKSLGALLVDQHGQHEHQSLLEPGRHIEFLDSWIGDPASKLIARMEVAYSTRSRLAADLALLQTGQRDRQQRLDMLRYQVEEIDGAAIQPGEFSRSEEELSRIANVERLRAACAVAIESIGGEEGSATERLALALKDLDSAAQLDPELESRAASIRSGLYAIQDGLRELRQYEELLESDPGRLELLVERMELLKKLRRKYGDSEQEILEFRDESARELELLDRAESSEGQIEEALAAAEQEARAVSKELTQLRTAHADRFTNLVEAELKQLAMERAALQIKIEPTEISPIGADSIELFFTANVGEQPKPLAKIASGGELSRVMLGIKIVLAGKGGVPTLVFDEIDSGLGGKTAAVVARKLEDLAHHYQVLAITHLPQICARAVAHYRIEKVERDSRTLTEIQPLGPEDRLTEIARMLAGDTVGDTAVANARELLRN